MKAAPVRIVVKLELRDASPWDLRRRFRKAIRDAVMQAYGNHVLDLPIAEEFIRAIPAVEDGE